MPNHYDLIVIGSGPGGLRGAIQASKLGKKVLIVEKDKIGGASVHTGTIPSKSLREAALSLKTESFPQAMKRMQKVVQDETKLLQAQLKSNSIEVAKGSAAFLDKNTISVGGKTSFSADYFLIATGARPIRHPEFSWPLVLDSDAVLKLKKLPKDILIIGAGVIGCEYASIFSCLGSNVTLADRRKELLRTVDHEIVECLREEFKAQNIKLLMGVDYGKIKRVGSAKLELILDKKKKKFDAILVCLGRTPNVESLNLEVLGIAKDERGNIKINENYQTAVSHVYAVGDVVGPPGLAASSAEQGRIAACKIFTAPCASFPKSFPYGIYTIPEISSVGAQEQELREKSIPYVVGKADFSEVARGLIVNEKGFIKILVHRENRKILGVHAIGSGATELIHIGQAIFALNAPIDYLVDNVFNYPTFAEAYKVAALNAVNKIRINS